MSACAKAQVTVDNCTTSSYTVVSIVCRDRKGLVYDLFRTLKDIHIRVAYAKACTETGVSTSHACGVNCNLYCTHASGDSRVKLLGTRQMAS